MISRSRLQEVLQRFSSLELAVLGDVMLDEYLWGKVDRISPEAPVPIVQVKRETWRPGGAANVASNLVALGASVQIFGVIGNDGAGRRLSETLQKEKVGTDGLIVDSSRSTTVKTRVIGHNQQMIRIDRESVEGLEHRCGKALTEMILKRAGSFAGLVVSDYSKGVVVEEVLSLLIDRFRKAGKFVSVDPRPKNFPLYTGATIITPNTKEAEGALGRTFESETEVLLGGQELLKKYKTDSILVTRGEQGMTLFEKGKNPLTIPTRALEVFDVTGAGDTVIATFSLALAAGCTSPEAAEVANLAAGVTVGIVGAATASPQAILDHYDRVNYRPN